MSMHPPQPDELPTWHVVDDSADEPMLWYGDTAVIQRCAPSPTNPYADRVWDVLTRVLAPDEATIEQLARVIHDVLCGCTEEDTPDCYHRAVHAVLAALGEGEATP